MDTTKMETLRTKGVALRSDIRKLITKPNASQRDLDRVAELSEDADALEQAYREELETALRAAKSSAMPNIASGEVAASLGKWVEERVLNNVSNAGFAPFAWRPTVQAALTGTSVANAAGFRVEYSADGLGDRVYAPAITVNPTASLTYSTATGLGTASASDPTITAGVVQFDRVQAMTLADNAILADAPTRYFDDIGNALVTSVSEKIDAVIFGGGTVTTALGSTSGAGTVSMGANGATIASTGPDPFLSALGTAIAAGAKPSVWVMNAQAYTALLKLKTLTSGSNTPLMFSNALSSLAGATPLTLGGLPVLVTSGTATIGNAETQGTATACTSAYLLDASQIGLFYRTETATSAPISLAADSSRYFEANQTAILASSRIGLRVYQPAAVTRIVGIIA